MKMTYRQALAIQKDQLLYYGMKLRYRARKALMEAIAERTLPCETPDTPMRMMAINELVPRGGKIESLFNSTSPTQRSTTRSFTYGDGWYW